jgi:hypothetical protein
MNGILTNSDLIRYVCSFLPMSNRATLSALSLSLHTTLSTCLQYRISFVDMSAWKEELIDMFAKQWKNTRRSQLSFAIQAYYSDDDIDASLLEGVHTVQLSYFCHVSNGSFLSNVHTLHLYYCNPLMDMSLLGGVHTLHLSHCNEITDVSALGSVYALTLTYLEHIIDVSALGCVHTLELYECQAITDVSALGGVHTLRMSYCWGITDVSALGGVHTLSLLCCVGVTDVSALGNVHTLQLDDLGQIRDVSALGKVHTLHISMDLRDRWVEMDVSALGSVHTLTLCGVGVTADISALGNVHTLTLKNCKYFNVWRVRFGVLFAYTFTFNSLDDGTMNVSMSTRTSRDHLTHNWNIVDCTQLTKEYLWSYARTRWWRLKLCDEMGARTPLM